MSTKFSSRIDVALNAFVLSLFFLTANRASWLCIFEVNHILFSCEYGKPTDELVLYAIALMVVVWLVYRQQQKNLYWRLWKENWILLLFLA